MNRTLVVALRATLVTLILTGIAYPLAITGLGQVLFHHAANGSFIQDDRGRVVGSALIGQPFRSPAYFQGRPSAAGSGYDATASGGSNHGPTSKQLAARVASDLARLKKENPNARGPVPDALVTASASGLDPDVPPAAARWQVPRIAAARGVAPERIEALVDSHVQSRSLGVLGEPTVNVLALNLALDRQFGAPIQLPRTR